MIEGGRVELWKMETEELYLACWNLVWLSTQLWIYFSFLSSFLSPGEVSSKKTSSLFSLYGILYFSNLPLSCIHREVHPPLISISPTPSSPLPPSLCVIHNGPSTGLHVPHAGGTPVFFNTFLIPPFDAPPVHHNLYWLLNQIKGASLAAWRLCSSVLQKKNHFLCQFPPVPPPRRPPGYVYSDMKVGPSLSPACCKSVLISSLIFLYWVCVCVCVCQHTHSVR